MTHHDTVVVMVRRVYGEEKFYPVNEAAYLFASISQTKTLTRAALKDIKQLGYNISFKHSEVVL